MPDLRDLLRDVAASPRRPLEGQAVVRAAERRLRRRRQLTSGIAAVAVIGLLVGVALNLPGQEAAVVLDDPSVAQEAPTDGSMAVVDGASGRFERVVLDGVQLRRHAEPSGDALMAEVVGVLEHDDDCGLQLHQEEVDVRHPVVWPDGTTLTGADPVTVRLPDGTTVTVGQHVSGSGGYHPHTELFPDGCTGAGETAVFNASMPVTASDAPADVPDPIQTTETDATEPGGPAGPVDPTDGATEEATLRDDERALLDAFVRFARSPTEQAPAPLRWADWVSLHLADGPAAATFTPAEATGPVWPLEADLFRAHTGPFNPLELIAETPFALTFGAGAHPHCASPPVPAPEGLADARRLWIQPEGTSSCLEWFTVDLFLDDAGAVTAVSMDIWEP